MKILVVDDEGIVIESCRRILKPEGFDIAAAKTADEALGIIEAEIPSLVLLDLKMPVHDGIYFMKEIKQRGKEIPIIVMSGYSTQDTMAEAETMGALLFLPKPFTPDELIEAVRKVIPGQA
jgi:DNA-binding NtrC family response regulator